MNTDRDADETWYNTDVPPPSRTWPWIWLMLLATGFVTLEVFADPAVVICIACSKLGWSDLVSAVWLRGRDPNSSRGATWCWFYVAHGFWKITVWTLAATLLLWMTAPWAPRHWQISLATVCLCCITFSLSSLVTCVAVLLARRHRLRVWVNSSIHRSRIRDEFPPQITGRNHAKRLVMTASVMIFCVSLTVASLFFALTCLLLDRQFANWQKDGMIDLIAGIAGVAIPIVLACSILVWRDLSQVVLSAHTPSHCW